MSAIVAELNRWYTAKGVREQEERTFKVGPSNLGDCLRKSAFLLSGMKPSPLTPEQVRVFELGHQRGAAMEAAAKECWPDAQSQVPIRIPIGKFELKGTIDLWLPSLATVIDFKTQATYGFGLLAEEGVSEDYQLQVHAYRDALAMGLGVDPRALRAVLVYEAKDSDARKGIKGGMLKELEVPWSDELEARYQKRLREVEGMLIRKEKGILDPREYAELPTGPRGGKSWKCKFCSVGEERGGCYQ